MNNPPPKKPKVDAFEGTMLLIDIYRHKMELYQFEKKVTMNVKVFEIGNAGLHKSTFLGEENPGTGSSTEEKTRGVSRPSCSIQIIRFLCG